MPTFNPASGSPAPTRAPNAFLAALLSLLTGGLGQYYCGYPLRAGLLWLAVNSAVILYLLGLLAYLPAHPAFDVLGVTLRLLLGLIVAVDAWRLARRHEPSRRRPNDWIVTLIFLGLWFGPRYVGTLGQFWPLGRTYHLPSGNMLPTLHVHDHVLAMPTRSPRLNDIVVFVPPDTYRGDKAMLVKRIVAVGGDTVAVEHGSLKRNGKIVDEPFVSEPIREDVPESKVAEGHFYMMGDNRNDSFDSRYWGTVPAENIKSRVVRVFWSEEWGQIGRKF